MKRNWALVLTLLLAVITLFALRGFTSAQGGRPADSADQAEGSAPAKKAPVTPGGGAPPAAGSEGGPPAATTPVSDDLASPSTVSDSLTVLRLKNSDAQVAVETLRQLYPAARIAADPRTNSIFVGNLSQAEIQEVQAVVRRLDEPTAVTDGQRGSAAGMAAGAAPPFTSGANERRRRARLEEPPLRSDDAPGAGAVTVSHCTITLHDGVIEFREHGYDAPKRIALAEVADRLRGKNYVRVEALADTPYSVVRQIVSAAEVEGARVELRDRGAGLPPDLMSTVSAEDRIGAAREKYEASERAAKELATKQNGVFKGHTRIVTVGEGGSGMGQFGSGGIGRGGEGIGGLGMAAGGGDDALRQKVTEAFEARQQLLRLELDQFRERLRRIEQTIETRERLKETIIQKRVEELLHPETRWDPADGNQQSNREEADRQAAGADISSRRVEAAAQRWQLVGDQFVTGNATLEEVLSAVTELTAAQLQQHPANPPQRLYILRRQVDLLTTTKDVITKRYQAGLATQSQVLSAETALLKAQQQLLKEFPVHSEPKTDLEKLQGTWRLVSLEINGEKPKSFVKHVLTIKDDKAAVSLERDPAPNVPSDRGNKGTLELTFTIDSSKSPKEITFSGAKGLKLLEIYRLEKDTLTLCKFGIAELARPKGFSMKDAGLGGGNNNLIVEVFRRDPTVLNKTFHGMPATVSNLSALMVAMHQYHDQHGYFPPAIILGKDGAGTVPHSWRVELLPYLGKRALYDDYHFDEPWDSEHNQKLLAKMPSVFGSPADVPGSVNASYFGIVWPVPAEAFTDPGDGSSIAAIADGVPVPKYSTIFSRPNGARMVEISDGTANTVALVEARRPIPWTSPEDISFLPAPGKRLPELGGWYPDGWHAGFADGSVKLISATNDSETIRALFTICGSEVTSPRIVERPAENARKNR